jgi:signal transduction histidine kinase
MMNHDIKAPLRSIKGFSQLLARTEQTETQKEYLAFISNSTNNLEALISDLLLYSKMNIIELDFDEINVESIIDAIISLFKYDIEDKNIQIIKENLPETIYGNFDGLRTVFQNLISNAIKYQPKDNANHIPEIRIKYESEEKFDVIYLKDNGIGIDEENIPDLFTPFIRFESAANYEGTGLGLSICHKIIEKHQGTINAIPVEEGTCFIIKFPKKI